MTTSSSRTACVRRLLIGPTASARIRTGARASRAAVPERHADACRGRGIATQNSDSFSNAWFCERYREWDSRLKPPLRQVQVVGENLFVDYSGRP